MRNGFLFRNVVGAERGSQSGVVRQKVGEMNSQQTTFGILVGVVVAAAFVIFIASGGGLGGKTTVNDDSDLPPVAMGALDR